MEDFLTAPPEGALDTAELEYLPQVNYKSGKTPEQYVKHATESLNDDVLAGRVGFYIYDREKKEQKTILNPAFVVLSVYAGIDGFDGDTRYWSNRVKDTRYDELRVFSSASFTWNGDKKTYKTIAEGRYETLKGKLPQGAKFTIFLVVMLVQTDEVVEIKTTAAVTRGLENALKATGQKRTFLLGLSDNDHIWGFRQTGFAPITKEGEPYAGKGEMFWAPVFQAGIIDPSKSLALHTKACQAQDAEHRRHAAFIAADQKRRALSADAAGAEYQAAEKAYYGEPTPKPAQTVTGINTHVTASAAASVFPTTAQTPPRVEPTADNDLPF